MTIEASELKTGDVRLVKCKYETPIFEQRLMTETHTRYICHFCGSYHWKAKEDKE